MNRAFFALSALAAVVGVVVAVVTVQSFRRPGAHVAGVARAEHIIGVGLLGVGAALYGASVFAETEDLGGPWFIPPTLFLAVTAILAWRRPDVAGRLLLWTAAIVVPLMFLIAVIVSGSNPHRTFTATLNNALGAVAFVMLYTIPAAVTGAVLYLAGRAGNRSARHSTFTRTGSNGG